MKFNSYHSSSSKIDELKNDLNSDGEIFILVYMDGCGPCNQMKPSWYDLKPQLEKQYTNRDDISIIDMERSMLPMLNELQDVESFPTIKYISKKKGKNEIYDGQRTTDDFIKWIEQNIDHVNSVGEPKQISLKELESSTSEPKTHSKKKSKKKKKKRDKKTQSGGKTKKKKRKRKWSLKYKRSGNCKKPKGFSQKQYCRNK